MDWSDDLEFRGIVLVVCRSLAVGRVERHMRDRLGDLGSEESDLVMTQKRLVVLWIAVTATAIWLWPMAAEIYRRMSVWDCVFVAVCVLCFGAGE